MGKLRRDPKDIHKNGGEPLRSWEILAKGVQSLKREPSNEDGVKKKKLPQGHLFDPLDKRFDLKEIA